jgi:hypothetical protein
MEATPLDFGSRLSLPGVCVERWECKPGFRHGPEWSQTAQRMRGSGI